MSVRIQETPLMRSILDSRPSKTPENEGLALRRKVALNCIEQSNAAKPVLPRIAVAKRRAAKSYQERQTQP